MKICAVVVTFNRKKLLIRSLFAIMSQRNATLDKIIIIDNASTDGTEFALREHDIINRKTCQSIEIEYVKLESNVGGAGGFNQGLSLAFEQGYDYFWVMDDDGFPDENCLSKLLSHADTHDFLSPLVLNELDHSKLSFGIDSIILRDEIDTLYKNVILIDGKANPFNGVLFSHKMLSKIGFPRAEMFIWGDENEYQQRAAKAGLKIATVRDAIHFHPQNRVKFKTIFKKYKINMPEGQLRQYCYFRNYTYIIKTYSTKVSLLKWYAKYLAYFVISRDVKGMLFFLRAASDAHKNKFNKHLDYLK